MDKLFWTVLIAGFLYLFKPDEFWAIAKGIGVLMFLYVVGALIWDFFFPKKTPEEKATLAKKKAGDDAEKFVQEVLRKHIKEQKDSSLALNNILFVFNAGASNEYSAEVDHIYIGKHNIYLIETKYKSGEIWARAEDNEWQTFKGGHKGSMRNALQQVKNTARILSTEFSLPAKIIPIVAIHGEDTVIVYGPSNVVTTDKLGQTIQTFEDYSNSDVVIDSSHISRLLLSKSSNDPRDLKRHIDRANRKVEERSIKKFIKNASID